MAYTNYQNLFTAEEKETLSAKAQDLLVELLTAEKKRTIGEGLQHLI